MLVNDPAAAVALAVALVLLLSFVLMRRRPIRSHNRSNHDGSLDTVASWPPEAARVMTATERNAFEVVRKALPAQWCSRRCRCRAFCDSHPAFL
jgi:hypothetical protein